MVRAASAAVTEDASDEMGCPFAVPFGLSLGADRIIRTRPRIRCNRGTKRVIINVSFILDEVIRHLRTRGLLIHTILLRYRVALPLLNVPQMSRGYCRLGIRKAHGDSRSHEPLHRHMEEVQELKTSLEDIYDPRSTNDPGISKIEMVSRISRHLSIVKEKYIGFAMEREEHAAYCPPGLSWSRWCCFPPMLVIP